MVETLDLFEGTSKTEGTLPVTNKKRRRNKKSDTAYRTISEVAKSLGVATHVLRFWETKFSEIQPLKRSGGRRYYRPEDISIIKNIQNLLHDKGYTIKGVQTVLNSQETQQHNKELPAILDKLYKLRNILVA